MTSPPEPVAQPEYFPLDAAPDETLDLGRLVLRRWAVDDIDELNRVVERSVTHLTPFMGWAAESTRETVLDYLERATREWQARETFQYAMRRPEDDVVVGSCGLRSRLGPGCLEIGYWVAVDQVRRGFATLASAGLTDTGFTLPGVERIEIHHDLANDASRGVPARLGFTILREDAVEATAPSESGTHFVWAMQARDWSASPGRALLAGRG